MNGDYQSFLASKQPRAVMRGLKGDALLADHLFPFQRECVDHNLRVGAAGLFLDTGMGKTEIQLEYLYHAMKATNGRGLLLTPLAVAQQTKRRADKYGYEARVIREMSDVGPGINICNYDRLDKIDPDAFGAVSLDEASILKSFTNKTTRALIDAFKGHRFKLTATATPAPNDHMEIGNYAEFLEIMAANEMLSRFFINDTSTASQEWRLKGHAEISFWDWMASWCRMAERPADLGDMETDSRFDLPPMEIIRHQAAQTEIKTDGNDLFAHLALSATNLHDVKRQTAAARTDVLGGFVTQDKPWIIWVDTDYEADSVKKALPFAVEVRGAQSIDEKESRLEAFASGDIKVLIGKPSMLGYGLDWSHCADMAFVGRGYSYETWYQAVRRCWRFGQTKPVNVHLIVAEGESEIGRVIDRKAMDHSKMKSAMRAAMLRSATTTQQTKIAYEPKHKGRLPSWLTATTNTTASGLRRSTETALAS